MRRVPLFIAATLMASLAASAASACLRIPKGSPDVEAARTLQYQQGLWRDAQSVFLARSERIRPLPKRTGNIPAGLGYQAMLVPLAQLKGVASHADVRVAHTGLTSCGLSPALAALEGSPDEVYVVYSRAAPPTGDSIIATLRPGDLVEPLALSAVRAVQATP